MSFPHRGSALASESPFRNLQHTDTKGSAPFLQEPPPPRASPRTLRQQGQQRGCQKHHIPHPTTLPLHNYSSAPALRAPTHFSEGEKFAAGSKGILRKHNTLFCLLSHPTSKATPPFPRLSSQRATPCTRNEGVQETSRPQ